jgi:hypothetical protein
MEESGNGDRRVDADRNSISKFQALWELPIDGTSNLKQDNGMMERKSIMQIQTAY